MSNKAVREMGMENNKKMSRNKGVSMGYISSQLTVEKNNFVRVRLEISQISQMRKPFLCSLANLKKAWN